MFTTYHPQIVTATPISVARKPNTHVEMLITSELLSSPGVPVVSLAVAAENENIIDAYTFRQCNFRCSVVLFSSLLLNRQSNYRRGREGNLCLL